MPSSAVLFWHRYMRIYVLTLAAFALALWCEIALNRGMARFTFLAFAPAVALSAWLGGRAPALWVVGLSVVAADYFLLGPGRLFRFDSVTEAVALLLFAASWSVVAVLAAAVSRQVERERGAKAAAERGASHAHRLAQTTAALGQARTSSEAIESTLQEPLHWLGADAGIFFVFSEDEKHITVARAVGYTVPAGAAWDLDVFGEHSPFAESIQRLAPIVVKSAAARKPEYATWASQGPWRDQEAHLILPIAVDRRVVSFVQLDFRSPRDFTVDEHEYVYVLCSRAAQAIDRTWSHEAADRAREDAESLKARADAELVERQKTEEALRASETRYRALATRTTRLHALTASLSEAASITAVTQAIVEQAHVVVGASEGDLKLPGDQGWQAEPGLCSTEALDSRRPVLVGSLQDAQKRFWRSATIAADRGFSSTAALPLLVENNPIGVLEFHFTAPVNFDEEYQTLLVSVAQHCTQALDRARLYEQSQRARAEAEAANRLKDEFVSTVSHELRTPLNAILGWASMLRTDAIDSEVVPQALDSIYRNASRQAKLVDDLLDFSRMAGGRNTLDVENIDAASLIRGIVESVIPLAAGNQIDIQLAALPEANLRGDVRRLEQVFVNLLGNALKFTPPGGRIMVSGRTNSRNFEVRVADDGIGIDPEFLPYVFDRFRQGDSTTTRNHPGLGLGLSIAKQLVEAHKGSIRVESAGTGKGTAFIVTLPLDGSSPSQARDADSPPAAEPRLDGIRILVVDDEKDARDLIERALEGRGAKITLTDNSRDAIDLLERSEFDVLLADIAIPEEDGYSLIRRVRSSKAGKLASIPAAAVTAHARDDERRMALAAGYHMHVSKPVEPYELVRMVNYLVNDRRRSRRSSA
jgi:signal transduction histidine kinase